jgi:hypothetical protein
VELVNKLVRSPYGALIVGTATSAAVGIAVFFAGAPPVILLPAILVAGTAYVEMRSRVRHRFDRH